MDVRKSLLWSPRIEFGFTALKMKFLDTVRQQTLF